MANTKKITVTVSEKLHKKATRAAKRLDLTLSDLIRNLIKVA